MVNDFLDPDVISAKLAQTAQAMGHKNITADKHLLVLDVLITVAKHIASNCQFEKGTAEYRLLEQSADIHQLECKIAIQAEQIAELQRRLS